MNRYFVIIHVKRFNFEMFGTHTISLEDTRSKNITECLPDRRKSKKELTDCPSQFSDISIYFVLQKLSDKKKYILYILSEKLSDKKNIFYTYFML